jgi:dihydrofolate reductase
MIMQKFHGLLLMLCSLTLLSCQNNPAGGSPVNPPFFSQGAETMTDSAVAGVLFIDTLSVTNHSNDSLTFSFIEGVSGMQLLDSIFMWTPHPEDTGNTVVSIQLANTKGPCDTMSWIIHMRTYFELVCSNAGFSRRYDHSSVVYDDKMWVIGGAELPEDKKRNDVWYSTNGADWVEATSSAAFSPRRNHCSTVFKNKMWVIGGSDSSFADKRDVWYSSDGKDWHLATDTAQFPGSSYSTVEVFNEKMWLIAGDKFNGSSTGNVASVHSSSDGINWIEVTNSAEFMARFSHTSVVFDNKIWVIGGYSEPGTYRNDVWSSEDGMTWTKKTDSAAFYIRMFPKAVSFHNKIWVIGGYIPSGGTSDVWYSANGIDWTLATKWAGFSDRYGSTVLVFQDKIWLIGGNAANNQVWRTSGE